MSMKTHEGSCTIRENELPQMRPNDTNFAQTGASCSLNWRRYSESGRPFGAVGCSRRRIPDKEILFYTNEASMSMKTHEGSCTIRENELPQMRPNDTKSAKTCCLFALFARVLSALKGRPSKDQANGLGGSGKRIFYFLPPALKGRDSCAFRRSPLQGSAGETAPFPRPLAWALLGRPFGAVSCMPRPASSLRHRATHLGHYLRLRWAAKIGIMSGAPDPVCGGLI